MQRALDHESIPPALLAHVVIGIGMMHDAAVVPDDHVAVRPDLLTWACTAIRTPRQLTVIVYNVYNRMQTPHSKGVPMIAVAHATNDATNVNAPENVQIVPTGAAAGAEIRGLDLSKPVPEATRALLRKAWADHLVLLWRDQ